MTPIKEVLERVRDMIHVRENDFYNSQDLEVNAEYFILQELEILLEKLDAKEQVIIKKAWENGYSIGMRMMDGGMVEPTTPKSSYDYYWKLNEELKNATKR